jgi:hypothetical protein
MMRPARLLLPMLLLAISACASVQIGRDFDLAAFESRVQRGVTTQTDVRAWLGAPSSVGVAVESSGGRYEEWAYYHGAGNLPDMGNARVKILQIKFDQRGLVQAYNWSGEPK